MGVSKEGQRPGFLFKMDSMGAGLLKAGLSRMRVKLQSTDGRAARGNGEGASPVSGEGGGERRWAGKSRGRCLSITSLFPAKSEAKPLAERVGGKDDKEVWSVSRIQVKRSCSTPDDRARWPE